MFGLKGINFRGENLDDIDAGNLLLGGARDLQLYNAGAAAIAAGDAVSLLPDNNAHGFMTSIEKLVVADARPDLIVGGALEAIPVGGWGLVRVRGLQGLVNVADAATVGDRVGVGAADGRVTDAAANTVLTPGIFVAVAGSGNRGTVWWQNPLGL